MKETVAVFENEVVLDVKALPLSVRETACRVIMSSVRRALADPVKRAEYEAWKRERAVGE